MRIIACVEHLDFHEADFTPDARWDKPGHLVGSGTLYPGGEVRWLSCDKGCRWATPAAVDDVGPDLSYLPTSPAVANVEKALGSAGNLSLARVWGNPSDAEAFDKATLTTPKQPIVNKASRIVNIRKEKNVAKDKTAPTRDRRPSLTKTLNFEGVQVTLAIKGTFEALLACDPQDLEHIKALQNLMEPDGMDKGEA